MLELIELEDTQQVSTCGLIAWCVGRNAHTSYIRSVALSESRKNTLGFPLSLIESQVDSHKFKCTDVMHLRIVRLTIFQCYNGAKGICIQWKLCYEF